MLTENDIVDAVCAYLEKEGYAILQKCSTIQQGIDIIAKHPRQTGRLLIEAKGATSSREGSERFGKGFTDNQIWDRVAKGFYTAVRLYGERASDGDTVGMAFPDGPRFQKYLAPIKPFLDKVGIVIFLVSEDRSVIKL